MENDYSVLHITPSGLLVAIFGRGKVRVTCPVSGIGVDKFGNFYYS